MRVIKMTFFMPIPIWKHLDFSNIYQAFPISQDIFLVFWLAVIICNKAIA